MTHNTDDAMSDRLSGMRRAYMLRGAAFLVLGLIGLFWPSGSVSLMLRVFGFFLLLDGAVQLWSIRQAGEPSNHLWTPLVTAIAGLVFLLLPTASIKLTFVLLGLWALVTGASYLLTWWRMPKTYPGRDSSRNTGILALVLGLVLVFWPGTGAVALGWTLAIMALVAALIMFYLASSFKRMNDIL
ncbi:HdeD family acid-resistance protein [Tropicibacter sp. Alg240-R139]|uniref:HdeD family acid-resistance protein n=1 Tax=Tropicibacter sp. Alg240-R139 TaxID=2305991 RepID=UPI0013DFD815|nr:DUF308 domain-containing protein [Tropicibacter sp. Alg240-R139]